MLLFGAALLWSRCLDCGLLYDRFRYMSRQPAIKT